MKSVVLLSGGLDSSVALAMAVRGGHQDVEALTVNYGQRHSREIHAAHSVARFFGVRQGLVDVSPSLFFGSALTNLSDMPDGHATEPDSTYVPARNAVLLALAAARAESIGARNVIIGANAADNAGYPDCRHEFIDAYRRVLNLGTVGHVWISTPLISMSKADIWRLALELGVPVDLTWSCYRGGDEPCGRCGACDELNKAKEEVLL